MAFQEKILRTSCIGECSIFPPSIFSDAAIANLDEAVKLGVEYDQWEIEMLLTEAFMQKADRTAARRHLERSVAMAPPEKRHMLRSLQSELGVR